MPWLKIEEAKVQESKDKIAADIKAFNDPPGGKPKPRKKRRYLRTPEVEARLPMRVASIRATRAILRVFFRVCAARVRDGKNVIVADSEPMYKRFATNPLFRHFSETGPCRVFGSASFNRVRL